MIFPLSSFFTGSITFSTIFGFTATTIISAFFTNSLAFLQALICLDSVSLSSLSQLFAHANILDVLTASALISPSQIALPMLPNPINPTFVLLSILFLIYLNSSALNFPTMFFSALDTVICDIPRLLAISD